MKISYEEFRTGKDFEERLEKLDEQILKALEDEAMQLRDILPYVEDTMKEMRYQTPFCYRIAARLKKLRDKGMVELKRISNKFFWGLTQEVQND